MKICTVSDAVGCSGFVFQNRLLNAVNSSGAVSPATRANARMTPVMMPGSAAGSITVNVARPRVAPSASAPSRSVDGTSRSSSSVVRAMIGIIITPSATLPASIENRCIGNTTMA